MRAQSEECPVPPPRKRRDRPKTSRRHTVGTLSVEQSINLVDEVPFESDIDKKCITVVPEDSNAPATKEQPMTKPDDTVDSERQRSLDGDTCEKFSSAPERTSLHSRIGSSMGLKREDSDFVDIDVEEAQLNDALQNTSSSTCIDSSSLKEAALPTGSTSDNCEVKVNVESSSERGKSEPGKSRFSKIKSLLSGKVSTYSFRLISDCLTCHRYIVYEVSEPI